MSRVVFGLDLSITPLPVRRRRLPRRSILPHQDKYPRLLPTRHHHQPQRDS